ncbi:hypothetical protein PVL29_008393 [Vitis rotundifolia]|uniref:DDE Tnp4 domain-containing protein n=1 Tax=Vitis rotundifolia TaxID=103349 RepID=A0AA39DU25_VITRO|nr:hypothetical protein PVL29_008393 [Vitis rotundifolia]
MAPPKKSKKAKRESKKSKKCKSMSVGPIEPRATESDWWDSFWQKNSPIPGSAIPTDEAEGFKFFFRVSKKTFDYICSLVRQDLVSRPPSGLINIQGRLLSVEKQVAIALRRLASGESQVSVGAAFGVGQSTVSQVTWRFIEAVEERAKHHLRWPDFNRMEEIKSKFETSYGLSNCCGAIDASHIIMTLPTVQTSDDWCDQENNYSMFLQGVVDDEMRFLDIVTGWPGGMTVARLLKCTGFYRNCEAGERLNVNIRILSEGVEIREYVVGGVGYPLLPWLITPCEYNDISSSMSGFKPNHEAARSLAVRAFSQLKGTWRILSKVCCLLHNIIIDSKDKLQPDVALSSHHDPGYGQQCCKQIDPLGKAMRENIAKHLQHGKEKAPSN